MRTLHFPAEEILETVRMVELETLDIRTTTLGISLLDCADPDLESACEKIYAKIVHHARTWSRSASRSPPTTASRSSTSASR